MNEPEDQSRDLSAAPKGCPLTRRRKPKGPKISLRRSIEEIDAPRWDGLAEGHGLFLQRSFLGAMEASSSEDQSPRYALFEDEEGHARGIACFQIARFQGQPLGALLACRARAFFTRRLKVLRDPLSYWLIVCGNPSITGEHGFVFDDGVEEAWAIKGLMSAARQIQEEQESLGRRVALLIKDLLPGAESIAEHLPKHGFADLHTEPSMILSLDEGWGSMDDYLQALTSKFRVKARRAFSKSKALEVRPLSPEDLEGLSKRIDQLYHGVVERAGFRLGEFSAESLKRLQLQLKDRFILLGYFLGEQLVGFLSGFVNDDSLEAHLVGIDYKINRAHGIYPRMLYDYLKIALERRLSQVHYGRTAQEIKSTLGAVPVPTRCFVRHSCPAFNAFLPLLARSINPGEFPTRRPFKETWYRLNEPQIKAHLGLIDPEVAT